MMTPIALAIVVASVYFVATTLGVTAGNEFFWVLVTLIVNMLLGHWFALTQGRPPERAAGAAARAART